MAGVSVEVRGLSKTFSSERVVFRSVDLNIAQGEFLGIVGASGCGKSTLLRLLAGLESKDSGDIRINPAAEIGFVFQEAHLLPWRTVQANVSLPLELRGVPAKERLERVEAALVKVGMQKESALYPAQLSGGMKMRVSLARALVMKPTLLLLDEPFAALDELTRVRLEEELRQLCSQSGITAVLVTHSFSEAVFLSDRIVMISTTVRGIGDKMQIALGARTQSLRIDPAFVSTVLDCRRRFESLENAR